MCFLGVNKKYRCTSNGSSYIKIKISAGYNGAAMCFCGQFPVNEPQIVNFLYTTSTIYEAKGYISDRAKVYFGMESGYGCFYVGNATLIGVLLSTTIYDSQGAIIELSEIPQLPSGVTEITVTKS